MIDYVPVAVCFPAFILQHAYCSMRLNQPYQLRRQNIRLRWVA